MDKYVNSEVNQHIMKLIQLGAEVQVVSGKMIYVKFVLTNDIEVAYVYHVNKNKKYFLERIKPYPLPISEFKSIHEIIQIIRIDLDQYTNASKSHNISDFIAINNDLHDTMKSFEDLFLYYNISPECVNSVKTNISNIKNIIKDNIKEEYRIYFEKEPENLD